MLFRFYVLHRDAKEDDMGAVQWKGEWKALLLIVGGFLACYYLPVGWPRFDNAINEALHLVKWYAQEHVILCLIPAFLLLVLSGYLSAGTRY